MRFGHAAHDSADSNNFQTLVMPYGGESKFSSSANLPFLDSHVAQLKRTQTNRIILNFKNPTN